MVWLRRWFGTNDVDPPSRSSSELRIGIRCIESGLQMVVVRAIRR